MLVIGNGRMITRDASSAFFENGAVAMDVQHHKDGGGN